MSFLIPSSTSLVFLLFPPSLYPILPRFTFPHTCTRGRSRLHTRTHTNPYTAHSHTRDARAFYHHSRRAGDSAFRVEPALVRRAMLFGRGSHNGKKKDARGRQVDGPAHRKWMRFDSRHRRRASTHLVSRRRQSLRPLVRTRRSSGNSGNEKDRRRRTSRRRRFRRYAVPFPRARSIPALRSSTSRRSKAPRRFTR